jgi:3-hydroxyisobutyrate dehydrogenase-like beta-hydroxyacid dehydrogenase
MSKETLGFIGVGMIGTPMAGRLMDAGYGLVVHDIDAARVEPFVARGAACADSDASETVLVSLPMPPVVREVALGARGIVGGNKVKTYIDLSTTGAVVATEVAEGLEAKGIACIDCPVSGGMKGAYSGTLSMMISGPKARAEAVTPII